MIRNVMPLVIGARGLSQGKGRIDLSRPESFDGIFDPDSLLWRIDLEKWLEGTLASGRKKSGGKSICATRNPGGIGSTRSQASDFHAPICPWKSRRRGSFRPSQ